MWPVNYKKSNSDYILIQYGHAIYQNYQNNIPFLNMVVYWCEIEKVYQTDTKK